MCSRKLQEIRDSIPFFDEDKRQLPVEMPRPLQSFGRNSDANGFKDIKNHPLTRNIKSMVNLTIADETSDEKEVTLKSIESYVCTLNEKKANRLNDILNNVPRKKKKRGFGQRYEDMIEAERVKSQYKTNYCNHHIKQKEPQRRSLDIINDKGRNTIQTFKDLGDKSRLDKTADICRGVRWVSKQYASTDRSTAQDELRAIDLKLVDRPETINKWESKVPFGTTDESRKSFLARQMQDKFRTKNKAWDTYSKTESEYMAYVEDALKDRSELKQASRGKHEGDQAAETFHCGHGSNKWKSETRNRFIFAENQDHQGGHKARGYTQAVNYKEPKPNDILGLWNCDTWPNPKDSNRKFFP